MAVTQGAAGLVAEIFKLLAEGRGQDGLQLGKAILPANDLPAPREFTLAPDATTGGGQGDDEHQHGSPPVRAARRF